MHIVKRENLPLWQKVCLYVGAVAAALLLGAVLLLAIGVDPIAYYNRMFTLGTVGNPIAYKVYANYLADLVPLVLTSLALSLAFKMKFWNIGGEGQFIMGALATAVVAIKLGGVLPTAVVLILMCLAAMVAAGIYGLIVAALKVKFGTNETLLTLMLNYVALYLLTYLMETKVPWNFLLDPTAVRPVPQSFDKMVKFPSIPLVGKFSLNVCVIFVVLIGLLIHVYLRRTKQGYEISVVGDSAGTARYAGMKVGPIVLRTVFLSACLIGLAAAFKVGSTGILSTTITEDVGWTGIIVAWLAQLNTWAIFLVSALVCVLHYGSTVAAATFAQVDSSFANMLQGVILFLVLAADFFTRFRVVMVKKGGSDHGNG
ncbi:MAG: ABC transporter permease [Oscillospiraceae bacterium]|nr:ABC transporter permease [Oscillospiraceae bacterium]